MQSNPELRQIFEADQLDRQQQHPDTWERDQARLARVEQLLAAGALRSGADHLHAAFIFQHGDRLEHYWQAHELALRAVELGAAHPARWLAAASYDRWLMHQGLPQKFGTQYRMSGGRFVLHQVDPTTTDADRARWDVPPLADAEAYAEQLNGAERPQPAAEPDLLAELKLPDLTVGLVAVSGAVAAPMPGAMPELTPIAPETLFPRPAYLPGGLELRQMGEGFCAVDAAGELQVSWIQLVVPPDQPLYLAWNTAEGPPPTPEALELPGRPAALFPAVWTPLTAERLPVVVLRSGPDSCWIVGGRLGRDELLRVAASLPG